MASLDYFLCILEHCWTLHTDKKENEIFLIYKEIHMGSVGCKVSMRKGFLIYEEMSKYFVIYEEAISYMNLQPIPSEFPYI
jgi:hypothetical protein